MTEATPSTINSFAELLATIDSSRLALLNDQLFSPGRGEVFEWMKERFKAFDRCAYSQDDLETILDSIDDPHGWVRCFLNTIQALQDNREPAKQDALMDSIAKLQHQAFDLKDPFRKDVLYFLHDKDRKIAEIDMPIVTVVEGAEEGQVRNLHVQLLEEGSGQWFPGMEMAFIEIDKQWKEAFELAFTELKNRYPQLEQVDVRWFVTHRLVRDQNDARALPQGVGHTSASMAFAFALEVLANRHVSLEAFAG